MTDVAALRRLPGALLSAGYVDAVCLRGPLNLSLAIAADLELLAPVTATLVKLFFLHGEVARAELDLVFPREDVDALLRLGVLIEREGKLSSGQLIALPVLGSLALIPAPASARTAYFGDDVALLLTRMPPVTGRVLCLDAGPGLLAMRAAASASAVIAVEHDPVAIGCAELNFAMNGIADRVAARSGVFYEPVAGEAFDLVVASAPASPVPVKTAKVYGGLDGPDVARRIVEGLPGALSPHGLAQIAAAWHGGDGGPSFGFDLDAWAATHGLRVMVTVSSRQLVTPGSPLFESIVARAARITRGDERALRKAHAEHLAARGSSYLYLSMMTISRSARPGVSVTRHYVAPGGSWQR